MILQILLETTSSFNVETTTKIAFDNELELLIVETHEIFESKHTVFGEQRHVLLRSNAPKRAI